MTIPGFFNGLFGKSGVDEVFKVDFIAGEHPFIGSRGYSAPSAPLGSFGSITSANQELAPGATVLTAYTLTNGNFQVILEGPNAVSYRNNLVFTFAGSQWNSANLSTSVSGNRLTIEKTNGGAVPIQNGQSFSVETISFG